MEYDGTKKDQEYGSEAKKSDAASKEMNEQHDHHGDQKKKEHTTEADKIGKF